MNRILVGLLMIFLDFNLTLNYSIIGLIPDFIGYIIMIKGLEEMAEESPLFQKVRPYASGMAVYAGVLYALDLFGVTVSLGFFSYLLVIVSLAVSLYISYNIVMGVRDMEDRYGRDLNGDQLKSRWMAAAVFSIAGFVTIIFPALAIIFVIVAFFIYIMFLVAFNRSKNLYEAMKLSGDGGVV